MNSLNVSYMGLLPRSFFPTWATLPIYPGGKLSTLYMSIGADSSHALLKHRHELLAGRVSGQDRCQPPPCLRHGQVNEVFTYCLARRTRRYTAGVKAGLEPLEWALTECFVNSPPWNIVVASDANSLRYC